MKKIALIATVLGAVALSMGFSAAYAADVTIDQPAFCPSQQNYEIDPATAGSTYNWGVTGGAETTDWVLSATTGTAVNVDWKTAGTYTIWSQETSAQNCIGPKTIVNVTVSPTPEVDPAENNICSVDQKTASTVDVVNLTLPAAKNIGAVVSKWNVTVDVKGTTPGTGNFAGGDTTDANAILNDSYTNSTSATIDVVYTITPYAGECAGTAVEYTVHVYPQVNAPTIKF